MAPHYDNHASALKEAELIHVELDEHIQAGHVTVFPLEEVWDLHTLWLSPLSVISQVGRRPHLIFDFTRSGLNKSKERLALIEAIRFGSEIHRILQQFFDADLYLGTIYISKADLADAHMRLWVIMDDVPYVAFLAPNKTPRNQQLLGFTLSLPMGYIDIAPYFCMSTKTVADLSNKAIDQRDVTSKHPMEKAPEDRAADDKGTSKAQYDAI